MPKKSEQYPIPENLADLKVIRYPDPRLLKEAATVEHFDKRLADLARRMIELMFEAKGVGLAAPQVGVSLKLFVASPTFEDTDKRFYVNPEIISAEGAQENEEGCLSLPGISQRIKRPRIITIRAMDLSGKVFEQTGEDLTARCFQHEMDHLEGRLILDRMGSLAHLSLRRTLADMEEQFKSKKR